MGTRKLLQTEIWSKRNTRKILVGLGIIAAGFGVWHEISLRWLTPGERKTARVALAQTDTLQNSDSLSDQEFGARAKLSIKSFGDAERAAWTTRDRAIVGKLRGYLSFEMLDRIRVEREQAAKQKRFVPPDWEQKWKQEMGLIESEQGKSPGSTLHQLLD
jgi:hypothetical protein